MVSGFADKRPTPKPRDRNKRHLPRSNPIQCSGPTLPIVANPFAPGHFSRTIEKILSPARRLCSGDLNRSDLFFISALLLLINVAPIRGQATESSILGTVTDPSGATVANSNITVASVETGNARKAVTNDANEYVVTNLPLGHYTVSAETRFQTGSSAASGNHRQGARMCRFCSAGTTSPFRSAASSSPVRTLTMN